MKRLFLFLAVMVLMAACSDDEKDKKMERVLNANDSISSYHMKMTSDDSEGFSKSTMTADYKDNSMQMTTKKAVTYMTGDDRYILAQNRVVKRKRLNDENTYEEQMKFLERYRSYFNVATEKDQIVFTSNRELLTDDKALDELNLNRSAVDEFSIEYIFDEDDKLKQFSVERLQKDEKRMYETVYHYSHVNQLKAIEVHPLIKEEMY
ncbi:hypothetical protein [Macrococcus lamae]|uniref:NDxxF motif lipoprotein n=1 Tax=Macrococcus lamae TaxID=198484 RepID=A0A4R6BUM8_9STAP|nr:hypothetical protein [Macrococcus lamae]TDM11938.1 hypothetical protein ERX29_04925 [Macrococcus lamae]